MARRPSEGNSGKKSEIVTVRFDPKLKYLAELAARKQRRPLSSYIEWAVEQSLGQVVLEEDSGESVSVASAERSHQLWDLDEPDRIVRLALHYPDLLTHEEQTLWKLIRENGLLWKGSYSGNPPVWSWKTQKSDLIWDRLREHWPTFRAVANGSKSRTELPTWQKTKPVQPVGTGHLSNQLEDDIPF
ncbi:MAG: hypothetical protein U1E20_09085 [Methylocystis sp.]|uniref:hypothetical protein n=1 Tax=Methylocystis sp. TaxID=1911079 RepID=UPI00392C4187